tara:strand:+ start:2581 stop:3090 length:510 start_codon:yes stop_codon:yes gene_type:complete
MSELIDSLKKHFRGDETFVISNERTSSIEVTTTKMFNISVLDSLTEQASLDVKSELLSRGYSIKFFNAEDGIIKVCVYDLPIAYLGGVFSSIPLFKGSVKIVKGSHLEIDVAKAYQYKQTLKSKKEAFVKEVSRKVKLAVERSLISKETPIKKNENLATGQVSFTLLVG